METYIYIQTYIHTYIYRQLVRYPSAMHYRAVVSIDKYIYLIKTYNSMENAEIVFISYLEDGNEGNGN